jgi:hypothetical protein
LVGLRPGSPSICSHCETLLTVRRLPSLGIALLSLAAIVGIVALVAPLGQTGFFVLGLPLTLAAWTALQVGLVSPVIYVPTPKICPGCNRDDAGYRTPWSTYCIGCVAAGRDRPDRAP